jgi:hypothetical protein
MLLFRVMNQPEEWRMISWAPNYEFSSLGRVRRITDAPGTYAGKIMSQAMSSGYLQLNLSLGGGKIVTRKVHRLICEAFHGAAPSVIHQAAHGDGNRTNNCANNLRWALPVENSSDDLANGVRPMGESHPLARLTEENVKEIRGAYADLVERFAKQHGIGKGYVRNIIAGRAWATRRLHAQPPDERAV